MIVTQQVNAELMEQVPKLTVCQNCWKAGRILAGSQTDERLTALGSQEYRAGVYCDNEIQDYSMRPNKKQTSEAVKILEQTP